MVPARLETLDGQREHVDLERIESAARWDRTAVWPARLLDSLVAGGEHGRQVDEPEWPGDVGAARSPTTQKVAERRPDRRASRKIGSGAMVVRAACTGDRLGELVAVGQLDQDREARGSDARVEPGGLVERLGRVVGGRAVDPVDEGGELGGRDATVRPRSHQGNGCGSRLTSARLEDARPQAELGRRLVEPATAEMPGRVCDIERAQLRRKHLRHGEAELTHVG